MRIKLLIIAFAASLLFIPQSQAQTSASGFPKGDLSNAKNHTGKIWLSELNVGDSTFDPSIAMAMYDAGAKLDWHIHPLPASIACENTYVSATRIANQKMQSWDSVSTNALSFGYRAESRFGSPIKS